MVVLRLTRTGKKKQAFYRIVVADSRRFVNSKFIEIVGWYNPHTKEVELKKDSLEAWLGKGAQPSNTVAKILKEHGIKLPDWVKITEKVRKPKKEPVEKPTPAAATEPTEEATPEAEVAETEAAEAPAPETPAEEEAEKVEESNTEENPE